MKRFCSECQFFDDKADLLDDRDGEGYCRRHTPQVRQQAEGHDVDRTGIWPIVAAWEWCGEFESKEEADGEVLNFQHIKLGVGPTC